MSTSASASARTAAAVVARRRRSQAAVQRVQDALAAMRREKARVSVAAVARRANVSRTFVYDNPQARAAVAAALAAADQRHTQMYPAQDDAQQAVWRQRALNAEDTLKSAYTEIARQRTRIGELLGQIRDLQAEWDDETIARIHHREHHAQAAGPAADHREPHAGGAPDRSAVHLALPGPAHR